MTTPPGQRPTSIRLFLADGTPEGFRMVEKSGWTGLGLVSSRSGFPAAKQRDEWARPGVYLLTGPPSGSGVRGRLYVGESEDVRQRMIDHGQKKDFWTGVIAFTSKDNSLNKAHIRYLEARLVQLAKKADRVDLENTTTPTLSPLSEADRADAEGFLLELLPVLPIVGVHAFEELHQPSVAKDQLVLTGPDATATGEDTGKGFIVFAGSLARAHAAPSIHTYLQTLRSQLAASGVLVPAGAQFRFTKHWLFDSPSTAAGVVLGRSANGRTEWKDATGATLKERQEAAAAAI